MNDVVIMGVDLSKHVFQVHGAAANGSVVFRKKLSRSQFAKFMAVQAPCRVAMEACATAHYWGRQLEAFGHSVQLIAPGYVKPFVKRQKNDAADAEAIVEAALRPTMRFVPVKSEEQQSRAILFRTRELLVGQRTQIADALRGHLAEYGFVVAQGIGNMRRLGEIIEDGSNKLPDLVRDVGRIYLMEYTTLSDQIISLQRRIETMARQDETARRVQTIPGIGPICAMAIETFAPPMENFHRGRDFAAWLGLVPRQNSTSGKQKLGRTSKMGQRDIRRLLIVGAMSVVQWRARRGASEGSWIARMLARKPRMVIAIALANKIARTIWAVLTRGEDYRSSAAVA